MTGRVLVAGVGNIFLGDDGFGVEVARRLASAGLPDWVRVADYGTSGVHLAYDIADGYQTTILVDAMPRGGSPGTVTVLEVGPEHRAGPEAAAAGPASGSRMFDAHGMQPDMVLGVLDMLGADTGRILVVGCEPGRVDYHIGLSEPVAAAVDDAVQVVKTLVADAGQARPAGGEDRPAARDTVAAGERRPAAGTDDL